MTKMTMTEQERAEASSSYERFLSFAAEPEWLNAVARVGDTVNGVTRALLAAGVEPTADAVVAAARLVLELGWRADDARRREARDAATDDRGGLTVVAA